MGSNVRIAFDASHNNVGNDEFSAAETFDVSQIPDNSQVNTEWCLQFMRSLKNVAFSTIDPGGLPAVRFMPVLAVTKNKLYFATISGRNIYKALKETEYVAIEGQAPDMRTVSLRGITVHVQDQDEKKRIIDRFYEINPDLGYFCSSEYRYTLEVFYIEDGEGEYYDPCQSTPFRRGFALRGTVVPEGIYDITTNCLQCGVCLDNCPEKCIIPGSPYSIQHERCLRCGLCLDVCPTRAIVHC